MNRIRILFKIRADIADKLLQPNIWRYTTHLEAYGIPGHQGKRGILCYDENRSHKFITFSCKCLAHLILRKATNNILKTLTLLTHVQVAKLVTE